MHLRQEIDARLDQLQVPFGRHGVDPFGVSKAHLANFYRVLGVLYKDYFRVRSYGVHNVPSCGRAMLVGNHSGGVAIDGAMVIASMFFDKNPPRLAQGMVEKFIAKVPFASAWSSRVGQFTGLPEHAQRLLDDDRLLMVFPEGSRGTAKLYWERTSLVHFGSGFVRLALASRAPIVPFAFIGGGDAVPTIFNAYKLGKLLGAPYVPITPYLFALPLPVPLAVHYGEPMTLEGTGSEDDATIEHKVAQVKARVAELIAKGELARRTGDGRLLTASERS